MKILLLNQVFYPDVVATAQHLSDLAVGLVESGHEVTVVSSRRAYEHPETIFPARETWRGVEIQRVYSSRFGKGSKWRRAADFASFLLCSFTRLLFLPKHDAVVALTTPPLISVLGAWRAKLWRARFIYWVMDFNPDEAIAAGWLRADSVAAKILEWLSKSSLRKADAIVALDRFMRDRIIAKGISGDKVAVIPPWSHDRDVAFDGPGRDKFRKDNGFNGKFVTMYSGNHSPVHPLATLMQAAEYLSSEKDLVFCFAGGGGQFQRVKKWAAERANAICLPYQPLDKLSASLSAADAHVVVMGDAMRGLVHPCKIYNILTVAAPVIYIGPEPSHATEILSQLSPNYPWIGIRHGEGAKLAKQIQLLRQQSFSHIRRMPVEIEGHFSQKVLLPKLIALIEPTRGATQTAKTCPQPS